MSKRGKSYPREFKLEAIRLCEETERPISEIARELGIKRTLLYRWKQQLVGKDAKSAFKGPGRPKINEMSEVNRLRRELHDVKEERDILKKAAAYFARDLK